MSGLESSVDQDVRRALSVPAGDRPAATRRVDDVETPLRPGDPIGVALIRGDLEVGATGTVTYVDGAQVYAFGHPFLGLGPAALPMTRAKVFTIIPSLDSSLKIAVLGPIAGTFTQDRATGKAERWAPGRPNSS